MGNIIFGIFRKDYHIKIGMVSHFQPKNSQIVAPLTEIVALFEKKIWGAFWRFSGQKRALPDSKHLATLGHME